MMREASKPPMGSPEDYLRRCIALARVARQSDDAPVGALVVRAGQVIAEGVEAVKAHHDVTAHAEIEAIRRACRALGSSDLGACVLYTTSEPCWMCSYAIRQTGIREVVIGAPVPTVGGVTSLHPILCDPHVGRWAAPPAIVWSELRDECEALHRKQKVGGVLGDS